MKTTIDIQKEVEFKRYIENYIIKSSGNKQYSIPNIIPTLYQYKRFVDYNVDNIINNTITLSTIRSFNDIYDSTIHIYSSETIRKSKAQNDYEELIASLAFDSIIDKSDYIKQRELFYLEESQLKFKTNEFLDTHVSCFTTKNDSILMWSHYADDNTGICVEYDFNKLEDGDLLKNLFYPVIYTDSPLDLQELIDDEKHQLFDYPLDAAVVCASLNKSKCWEYEKEWRIVLITTINHQPKYYNAKLSFLPSNVYLGFHFLKLFFYNKDNEEYKKDGVGSKEYINAQNNLELFIKLLNYLSDKKIPLSYTDITIGAFKLRKVQITIPQLESFLSNCFANNKPKELNQYDNIQKQFFKMVLR